MCDRLRENLERLNHELDAFAQGEGFDIEAKPTLFGNDVEHIASRLPLTHSISRSTLLELYPGNIILSQALLAARDGAGEDPSSPEDPTIEMRLETDGFVFTYVGSFGYPETTCGFVFSAAYEASRADDCVTTPFDSGALVDYLLPSRTLDEQRAFLHKHEIPVPDYRKYLAKTLRLLFRDPNKYLDLHDQDIPSPFPFEGGDYRRWLFEVRFSETIPLAGSLLAVVLPSTLGGDDGILRWVSGLQEQDVQVDWYRSPHIEGDWTQLLRSGRRCVTREAGMGAQ